MTILQIELRIINILDAGRVTFFTQVLWSQSIQNFQKFPSSS